MSTVTVESVTTWRRSVKCLRGGGSWPSCPLGPDVLQPADVSATQTNKVEKGGPVANYKELIARGVSATTNLVGTRYTASAGKLSITVHAPAFGCHTRQQVNGHNLNTLSFNTPPAFSVDPVADQKAATKLLESLIDVQNDWRGGNFLAEFAETVKMLRNPLDGIHRNTSRLIQKATSMKRLFRRSPKEYGELLGGAWLSWSWGVKPLLADVAELENAISTMGTSLGSSDVLHIRGSGRNTVPQSPQVFAIPGCSAALAVHRDVYSSSSRYYGAVHARAPGSSALLGHFGFTPEDILPAVWEAIPWSAVIDYFVNVNTKIESLRWATANLAWLNHTVRNSRTRSFSNCFPNPAFTLTGYNVTARGGAAYTTVTRVSRQPTLPPYPAWEFSIPNTPTKWLNIAALAAGIRASKPLR